MSDAPQKRSAPTEAQEPGPLDITVDDLAAELTTITGEKDQHLALARIKIRKQAALIDQLQSELASKAPAHDEDA